MSAFPSLRHIAAGFCVYCGDVHTSTSGIAMSAWTPQGKDGPFLRVQGTDHHDDGYHPCPAGCKALET